MTATAPPMGRTQTQPHTATPQDLEEAAIHRIVAPLLAQGWRKRDALRRAREELDMPAPTRSRPDPFRNHKMPDIVHTDGTSPTALWDIENDGGRQCPHP